MDATARKLIIAASLLMLAISPAAAAHPGLYAHHFGRWIGYGWSDGYHAYDSCPNCPRRAAKSPTWLKLDSPVQGPLLKPLPPPPADTAIETLPVPLPTN